MRILSYNIHKGLSANNKRFILMQIKEAIVNSDAEIVFLQEVLGDHKRHQLKFADWPMESQFERLADGLWPHYAYGRNAVYKHGHHGNAILSKFPIVEFSNTNISTNRFENRGILHAKIKHVPTDLTVHALCIHLGLTTRGRKIQLQRLVDLVKAQIPEDAPLIVAGDFNDVDKKASRMLESELRLTESYKTKHGRYAKTFPSHFPVLPLDRLYSRNVVVEHAKVGRGEPWRGLSDHLPVMAEVNLVAP